MVLKADQERVKTLLKDTITLLCKNGLSFKTTFSVEALIGVTLDESDVFLVSINEIIKSEKLIAEEAAAAADQSDTSTDDDERYSTSNNKSSAKRPAIKNQKTRPERERERESKQRRSQSPDDRKAKRMKVVDHPPAVKPEPGHSSEEGEEDEDEEEEEMRRLEQMHHHSMMQGSSGNHPPPHMWDDEDEEEEPDSMDESFEDSNEPFPHEMGHGHGGPHGRMQHMGHGQQQFRDFRQQQAKLQHQMQQHRQQQHHHQQQQQQQQQQQHQKIKSEKQNQGQLPQKNLPVSGPGDEESEEIMYIKEEPDDEGMWPPDDEDHGDEGMHPDSMYGNMAAADTTGLPEDHNFSSLSGMELVPVSQQDANAMWEQSSPSRQYHGGRGGTSRTSTVTSDGGNAEHGNMQNQMNPSGDPAQDEESCVFTVYEDEIMPHPNKGPALQSTMYFCQICGRSFGSLKTYNIHKNEHKGIFKFNCEECQQGFSTKLKYETHVRRDHTGERFGCTICGKSFLSKAGLQRHLKTVHKNS